MSAFKLVTIGVFLLLIIGGVLVFARLGTSGNSGPGSQVVIWGTLPEVTINNIIRDVNQKSAVINATYAQIDPANFDTILVNALAEGKGPDVVLIPESEIAKDQNKLFTIPFTSYPERTFKDTFVSEGELFLTANGVLGIPFSIDPLVMYWNRDIFSSAGLANPPAYWSDIPAIAPKIIQIDQASHIKQSLISFGETANVTHAKEILAALFLQSGNPIVIRDAQSGSLVSVLDQKNDTTGATAGSVIDFYTQFADPTNKFYSWSRSLPASKDDFLAGNLALYVGYASEASDLQAKNPNLNFDVAPLPQPSPSANKITYGKLSAFAITKSSKNIAGSLSTIFALTSPASITTLTNTLNLPPVRRDLLAQNPGNANLTVFYQSALQSRGWYDPDPAKSDDIFQTMIQSVSTNSRHSSEAAADARAEIQDLLK
ncbi:MAG: ABC transporter substrate-binding protein [Candidatus Pacebacteria bacterium]|nr:ABC transporter substrate-binding protein [Candidatus Paceibacterota bacterium]